jgi:hypothetical protein
MTARLWANLSWLYEDAEDEDMARFAAKNAADAFGAVYSGERLTATQEQAVAMGAAGMLYRAGVEENLKKYLLDVKMNKAGSKIYTLLAEDLLDIISQGK